jgi:hypothetical protein
MMQKAARATFLNAKSGFTPSQHCGGILIVNGTKSAVSLRGNK